MKYFLILLALILWAAPMSHASGLLDNRVLWNRAGAWSVYDRDKGSADWGDMTIDLTGALGGPGDIPALADINGDGLDDRVVVRAVGGGWNYYCRYTDPNGSLPNSTVINGAGAASDLDVILFGDIDGDGIDDVILYRSGLWAYRASNHVQGFASGNWSVMQGFGGDIDDTPRMGDINGDGIADRILVRIVGAGLSVMVNYSKADGSGFVDAATIDTAKMLGDYTTDSVSISDINGDGKDDLVLVRKNADNSYTLFGFYTLADGTLSTTGPDIQYNGADWNTYDWLFGHVHAAAPVVPAVSAPENRLIYAGGMWYGYNRDNGAANWGDGVIDKTGPLGGAEGDKPYLADINGDGLDDLIVVRLENGGVSYYCNYTAADGTLASSTVVIGAGGDATKDTVIFGGDINNDRIDDPILVRQSGSGVLKWGVRQSTGPGFASNGDWGPFTTTPNYAFGINSDTPLAGDLNGDGIVDRVVARSENGYWTVYVDYSVAYGWGDAVVDKSRIFGVSATDTISLSDINGDGKDDVVVMRKNADFSISLFGYYTLADGTLGNAAPDIAYTGGDYRLHEWVFGRFEPLPQTCTTPPPGDFDGNCKVDFADFAQFASHWLECTMPGDARCVTKF